MFLIWFWRACPPDMIWRQCLAFNETVELAYHVALDGPSLQGLGVYARSARLSVEMAGEALFFHRPVYRDRFIGSCRVTASGCRR